VIIKNRFGAGSGKPKQEEMEMKVKKSVIMAACAACALAGQADVVIKFDGATADAATAQANVGATGTQTLAPGETFTQSLAYSTTVPKFSPGTPANYLSGQPIYAGHYMMWTNTSASTVTNSGVTALAYRGGTEPEDIQISAGTTSTVIGRQLNFAILFELNTSGNYGFDAASTLTINMKAFAAGERDTRWVVVAGNGSTYVSAATVGSLATSLTDYTLSDPDEINWAVWTPGADMSFGTLTYNVAGSTLTNITHAGIAENGYTLGTARIGYIAGFEGDLYLIPEPATIGMLGIGALVAMVLRRTF